MDNKMLEFVGRVRTVSPNACFIDVDGIKAWIPDSLADYIDEPEDYEEIRFLIPKWLAEKKGFI